MGNKTKGGKVRHVKATPQPVKKAKKTKAETKVVRPVKAKKKTTAVTVPEPEVEIEQEDVEFFEQNAEYSKFLQKMNVSDLNQKKETVDVAEAKPRRKPEWETKEAAEKLPIKDAQGKLHPKPLIEEDEEEEQVKSSSSSESFSSSSEEEDELSDIEMEEEVEPQVVKILKTPEEIRTEKKILMAKLSESLLEDPEQGIKRSKDDPKELSKLQQLHALCTDEDFTIAKYAMISLLTVYLDILPGYRIRLPTTAETKQKKKIQQLQTFEASILVNYQKFLKLLDQCAIVGLKRKKDEGYVDEIQRYTRGETAVKCLSELLKHKYHFNFSTNLIMAIIPHADSRWPKVSEFASTALEFVFKNDNSGAVSLEIVKQMTQYIKKKNNNVRERFLKSLLALKLSVTLEEGQSARKQAKIERKKRRRMINEGDTIAAGLKEAEAVVDKTEKQKNQANILHEVVLIYFRILKNTENSPALPAILDGLSKWAFLINLDVMIDLLAMLKVLLKAEKLPVESALSAILTGLRALKGPGRELMVDEKDFVNILYKMLFRLVEDRHRSCFPIALNCVEELFLKNKEIQVDRVAAFVRRLLLVSVALPHHQVLAVLALVRSLFHRYTRLQQLLDSESDHIASGVYRSDVDDPDFSNPYASSCWELALLRFHWHPKAASFSLGTAKLEATLPNENPVAMMTKYNVEFNGQFVPKLVVPKPNPFHGKLQGKRKSRPIYIRDSKLPTPFLKKLKLRQEELSTDLII